MARGELRVYMGAAPGVGKTFAMLNEGWRRKERGTDVVIGFVETHGRPMTAAQTRDLEIVPRRTITYRGQDFEEMDLDAVRARKPEVVLVDELAHTNIPGSRNQKRWQDIEELLDVGITVISTLNIQHLESLNDVVQRITGVGQRETVPDAWVRQADQIELVDMTPEALRRRMAHGNIYAPEKVDAALGHYFRVGNLGALRELALLWVADRVDEALQEYRERHGIVDAWETRERVVVALTGAPAGEHLVRRGARMAARSHAELVGVHVRSADGLAGPNQELLERHRQLLEELGGRYAEVTGSDTAAALVQFARAENATQLLLGSSGRTRWAELTHGSVINRVIRDAAAFDVHVISEDAGRATLTATSTASASRRRFRREPINRPARARVLAWVLALVVGPLAALALTPLRSTIGVGAILLLLLLLPISAALLGGVAPGVISAIVTFLFADWQYVEPIHTIRINHATEALALVMYIVVAIVVSLLVDRLARRSSQLARTQTESEALAQLASSSVSLEPTALAHLTEELRATLGFDAVAVLAPEPDGWRVEASAGEPVPPRPEGASFAAELADGSMLVVAGPAIAAEQRRLLGAFVAQLRVAQSALRLHTEAARADALAEANNVRDALLAAVSHDLRGPLANIKAAATSLLSDEVEWNADDVRGFCTTIDVEVDRLHTLVSNLLDMGRLQTGMLGVTIEPVLIEQAVYGALASLGVDRTDGVDVDLPIELPAAAADPALLERALANVIANARNWSAPGSAVRITAGVAGDRVDVRVIDRGVGIPLDQRDAVFQPFQRLGDGGRAAYDGVGLGLAVTKGVIEAMSGRVIIDDTPGGGTTVVISLETAS